MTRKLLTLVLAFATVGCSKVAPLDIADGDAGALDATSADMAALDATPDAPIDLSVVDATTDLAPDAPVDAAPDLSGPVACSTNEECRGWVPTDPMREGCGVPQCILGTCGIDVRFAVSCASGYMCNYTTGSCVIARE